MKIELKAYEAKINLPLLNDITAFVLDTVEATYTQRNELYARCPFLYSRENTFQEKYQFLYLGELLERYEERFGMSIQDLRAIALALGFTQNYLTSEMFVGPQKENFLRKVRQSADGDIYLNGALYLLEEGQSGMAERELKLTNRQYDSTEDLLFAAGLFQDHERAFLHFKPQLLRLLGPERTIPVLGNVTALNWLITWLMPMLKSSKGKDMVLFRALCALPKSHVKPENKSYNVLLEHGYTPLEIVYANTLTILFQTAPGVLRTDSIVIEKIVIALFHEVLPCENPFASEIYNQLAQVYRLYENFKIKCYGHARLLQALEDGTRIQNAETFIWFSKLADIYHQVFSGFDIMDTKWDALATALGPKQYRPLFEFCLGDDMSQEEIQSRLDRYQELTGKNYSDIYWDSAYGNRFHLLIDKNILDLWELFKNSLDENGGIAKAEMLSHIWGYVHTVHTKQAYQFYEQFFASYGPEKLEKLFGYRHREFLESLTDHQSYYYGSQAPIKLKLHRDYLDQDGHRQLLHWLEEYVFVYKPEQYLPLVTAILQDEFAASLFSSDEQRAMFDLTIKRPDISRDTLNALKRHYLTEAELQAEQETEAAARREAEHLKQVELVRSIREHYEEILDGKYSSVIRFLDEYRYYREKLPIACRIVRESLDELLDAKCYELDGQDAAGFLYVCNKLVKHKTMSFTEVQNYIIKVKERVEDDPGN